MAAKLELWDVRVRVVAPVRGVHHDAASGGRQQVDELRDRERVVGCVLDVVTSGVFQEVDPILRRTRFHEGSSPTTST